jgi:TatD DNase family protein
MQSTPFFDIHAHANSDWLEHTIYSFDCQQIDPIQKLPPQYSIGLHPWYLQEDTTDSLLEQIEKKLQDQSCKMVGECGLDRLRGPEIKIQWQALEDQADLAMQANRPLLLHCVRAYDLLLSFRKKQYHHIPMIIHGFRGSLELASQLTQKGYFLSFGPMVLQSPEKLKALLTTLDLPFFLETDEHQMSIEDFYYQTAILLQIEVDELKDRIFAGWKLIGLL